MCFPALEDGRLTRFALTPTQTRRFRVNYAPEEGMRWLMETLNREGGNSARGWPGWRRGICSFIGVSGGCGVLLHPMVMLNQD